MALRKIDESKLEINDIRKITRICRAKLTDRIYSEEYRKRLGLEGINSVLKKEG